MTAALRELGLIVAEKRPYIHSVGHCSRCDTVIEPRLSLQWFVKVESLAKAAGDARARRSGDDPSARDGAQLLRLGRQHARLVHLAAALVGSPHSGLVRAGRRGGGASVLTTMPPSGDGWRQDDDVLDTWFSSALWPFSTLGWPADDGRPREVLSDVGAAHRLRHHLLLGRPDDDVRPVRDGRSRVRPARCRSARLR